MNVSYIYFYAYFLHQHQLNCNKMIVNICVCVYIIVLMPCHVRMERCGFGWYVRVFSMAAVAATVTAAH